MSRDLWAALLFVGLVILLVGIGASIYVVGWAIVVWTFGVNAFWGVIVGAVWLMLTGGLTIGARRS